LVAACRSVGQALSPANRARKQAVWQSVSILVGARA
jgi:hypothetical protein